MSSPLARYRQLAPTAAVRVSPICLGAMTFGSKNDERYGKCDKETSFAILDAFYENGGNFIDTANTYREGESEEWVGEWMASRGNRDEIVLATKYTNPARPARSKKSIEVNMIGNNLKSMRLSVEASLKRLQTSYIDLFYVHVWDYTTSIAELMHGLNDLVVSGKVLYLGISDTPAWIVAKCNEYARQNRLRPFAVYQGMWSATMRDFEREIIPMAIHEGMALCPYGTLNQGRFQTREGFKQRDEAEKNGTHEGRNFIPTSERDRAVSAVLEDLAATRGDETTLLQVAIAYVLHKAPYVFPLVGARKVDHLTGNFPAFDLALSEEELQRIDGAYEFEHGFPSDFLCGSLFKPEQKSEMVTHPSQVWLTAKPNFEYVEGVKPIRPKEE
ncbi:hypothetical protein JCM6882_005876 [Rhodosporidiobolus microsporus]